MAPETQIDELQKKKITNFLQDSWANMANADKDDDQGVDFFQEKDFKLVSSKRRKHGKTLTIDYTRRVPSQKDLTQ